MATPTLEKTYSFGHWSAASLGNQDNDNRNLFMNWKDLMVAAGWTIVGSSGTSSYNLTGTDEWTAYSQLGASRWMVLQNTAIQSTFQICLQMDGSTSITESSALRVSPSGDYINSTTESLTSRPTASDEFELNTNWFSLSSAAGTRRVDIVYSDDGEVWWMWACCGGTYQGNAGYFGVPKNPHASWTNKWIAFFHSWTSARLMANSDFRVQCGDVTGLRAIAEGSNGAWLTRHTRYQTVDAAGDWFVQPLQFLWSIDMNGPGFWGALYDWYIAPPALATGTEFPSAGAVEFLKIDDLLVPWDDTAWP